MCLDTENDSVTGRIAGKIQGVVHSATEHPLKILKKLNKMYAVRKKD